MTLADRIREAVGDRSSAEIARLAGVTPGAVTQWLDGTTKSLKHEKLVKLEAATGYRATWIQSGVGPKRTDLVQPSAHSAAEEVPMYARGPARAPSMAPILAWEHEEDLPPGDFVMIPRLGVKLSAGPGRDQVEIEFVERQPQAFRADWIRKKRLKPTKLASMVAIGTSMEDRIHDGDALVVDTSQQEVIDGKVYALWYEGGERVKRLYRMPGGGLRIRSDNAAEHPEIVLNAAEAEHVRVIGRVVHIAGEGGL